MTSRLRGSLEELFPDLLVKNTRNFLLTATSALTKVGGQANGYFSRLSQALTFERMMRDFLRLTAWTSPFPLPSASDFWRTMFLPPTQPASPWSAVVAARQNVPSWPLLPALFQQHSRPGNQSVGGDLVDYASFLLPAILFAAGPLFGSFWSAGV